VPSDELAAIWQTPVPKPLRQDLAEFDDPYGR
jgi:hypothetical protein